MGYFVLHCNPFLNLIVGWGKGGGGAPPKSCLKLTACLSAWCLLLGHQWCTDLHRNPQQFNCSGDGVTEEFSVRVDKNQVRWWGQTCSRRKPTLNWHMETFLSSTPSTCPSTHSHLSVLELYPFPLWFHHVLYDSIQWVQSRFTSDPLCRCTVYGEWKEKRQEEQEGERLFLLLWFKYRNMLFGWKQTKHWRRRCTMVWWLLSPTSYLRFSLEELHTPVMYSCHDPLTG